MTDLVESKFPVDNIKSIFGVAIIDISRESALLRLSKAIDQREHIKLAFCNAHTANLAWDDKAIRTTLQNFTVFADGVGVDIAANQLYGAKFRANLNGTDFVPEFLVTSKRPLRIAMIGAAGHIAKRAAHELQFASPQHVYTPIIHGYSTPAEQQEFLKSLLASPVDVLLVAMGNPKQEQWIEKNITGKHATIAIGVGALFDFLAGEITRAPKLIRWGRFEWLFRLAQEPKRLFKRYLLGNPLFLARVAMVKFGLRRF